MTVVHDRPELGESEIELERTSEPPAITPLRVLVVGAAASIAAGVIHAAAIASHAEHRAAVWTFLIVAVVQIAWGGYALARPSRWVAALGMVISAGLLGGWILAKSSGLSFISGLDVKESIQLADGMAAALAAITVVTAGASLLWRRFMPAWSLVGFVAAAVLVSSGPGTMAALEHHHASGKGGVLVKAAPVPPHPFDPSLPIDLSGVPGVTPQQEARAQALLSATVQELPQWSDPAYDEAHGFFSIGDGRSGVEHYLNLKFIGDDTMLDPDKPESLVFDTTVKPKRLAAAMYMATPGMGLDQVPDIGGPLTQWHMHNNLCFTTKGAVVALTKADGTCPKGLIKGANTPMIHVWILPHPCGPFAALEGVGGGQIKAGETKACDHVHGTN